MWPWHIQNLSIINYRIVKSDSFDDATTLFPDTQIDTEDDGITADIIIHYGIAGTCQQGKLQQTLLQINMK